MLKIAKALKGVKEECSKQGKRYPIEVLIVSILCAKLCGAEDLTSCYNLLSGLKRKLKKALGFEKDFPCQKTFERRFKNVEPEHFETMASDVIDWLLTDKFGKKIYNQLCADGKAVKSSKDANGNSYHMLNIYDPDRQALHSHSRSSKGGGEIKTALKLFEKIDVTGKVVTADAMFTNSQLCDLIKQKGGDYIFYVKGNQKTLYEDIQKMFELYEHAFPDSLPSYTMKDTKHGRKEHRKINVMYFPFSAEKYGFDGAIHVAHIQRKRYKYRNKKIIQRSLEDVYLITSLPADKFLPQKLLHYNRNHWGIENHCHRYKDMVLHEDKYTFSNDAMVRVMTSLNNIANFILMKVKNENDKSMKNITQTFMQKTHRLITKLDKIVVNAHKINGEFA